MCDDGWNKAFGAELTTVHAGIKLEWCTPETYVRLLTNVTSI